MSLPPRSKKCPRSRSRNVNRLVQPYQFISSCNPDPTIINLDLNLPKRPLKNVKGKFSKNISKSKRKKYDHIPSRDITALDHILKKYPTPFNTRKGSKVSPQASNLVYSCSCSPKFPEILKATANYSPRVLKPFPKVMPVIPRTRWMASQTDRKIPIDIPLQRYQMNLTDVGSKAYLQLTCGDVGPLQELRKPKKGGGHVVRAKLKKTKSGSLPPVTSTARVTFIQEPKHSEDENPKKLIEIACNNDVQVSGQSCSTKTASKPKKKSKKWTGPLVPEGYEGMSEVYYRLLENRFAQPADPSVYRLEKFAVEEEGRKLLDKFDAKEKEKSRLKFTEKCQQICQNPYSQMSEARKRIEIKKYGERLKKRQSDEQSAWNYWTSFHSEDFYIPKNKVNFGCERLRKLAEIQRNVVFTIVRRFVTGPSDRELFWLNRTEAVDCWRRIVGTGKVPTIQKCCVEAPSTNRQKIWIPSLQNKNQKAATIPKKSKLPPFCDEYPSEEFRMPWHIPALKPRDGSDHRVKYHCERTLDLNDIINKKWDPYGEDRARQRYELVVETREAMVDHFFKLTEPAQVHTQAEVIKLLARASGSHDALTTAKHARSHRDMVLAGLLNKTATANNAAEVRMEEQKLERQKLKEQRLIQEDFSTVSSRYLEIGGRGQQLKRTKTWKSKKKLKFK